MVGRICERVESGEGVGHKQMLFDKLQSFICLCPVWKGSSFFLCKQSNSDLMLHNYEQIRVNRSAWFVEIREESWNKFGTIGDERRVPSAVNWFESHVDCLFAAGPSSIISAKHLAATHANTFNVDDDPDEKNLSIRLHVRSTALWLNQHVSDLSASKSGEKQLQYLKNIILTRLRTYERNVHQAWNSCTIQHT